MKEKDLLDDLGSIKNIMERSTKFISLSGLSGVMAGVYALAGAGVAYRLLNAYVEGGRFGGQILTMRLFLIACAVLTLSLITGLWLTVRKAHRKNLSVINPSSRALLFSGAIPLVGGGTFLLILLYQGYYGIICPGCLVFYGMALVAASQHTYGDVKWLGLCEIALGLLAAAMPGYGLIYWTVGFGVLHILYGTVMHFKYDREGSTT
ncbi:hypothetical protein ACFGVR_06230 [Mucilaginibacter sp. AW1-3]